MLPPGIHRASLVEVKHRFATNDHRSYLFGGFRRGVKALRIAGCGGIYLDGSFVTEKPEPVDYDVCWDTSGVDVHKLDPVFLDFADDRRKQKDKYLGEFFPANAIADGSSVFLDFFQRDKDTDKPRGMIRISPPGKKRGGATP